MAWSYSLDGYWTLKAPKEFPCPCAMDKYRTVELVPGDVLTKGANGTMTKHNGLCMINIHVPDDDLERVDGSVKMVIGSVCDA